MGNKVTYLIWGVIILVLCGVVFWVVSPLIWHNGTNEYDFYIRLFLFMFLVNTFAVLRLYNSIVQNTRFAIKLREALLKFQQAVPGLERSMRNLNSSIGNAKASTDGLRKSLLVCNEKTEQLTEKLNNLKNLKA